MSYVRITSWRARINSDQVLIPLFSTALFVEGSAPAQPFHQPLAVVFVEGQKQPKKIKRFITVIVESLSTPNVRLHTGSFMDRLMHTVDNYERAPSRNPVAVREARRHGRGHFECVLERNGVNYRHNNQLTEICQKIDSIPSGAQQRD